MDRSQVGIVIPAFNESATIESVVRAVGIYGLPIVVDDGSADDTLRLAVAAGAVVVSHPENYGYDPALNSGFKKAVEMGMKIIITVDADGQHVPSLILGFINMIDEGADVVIGVRDERQRFSEHLFAWYTKFCFGIKDPLCGMKAYRKEVYESLGHFDSYKSIGTELMLFAAKNRFRISQVLIATQRRNGQPRFGKSISGNYMIIRAMLFSLWRVKKSNSLCQKTEN
jgi:glycosyltransferase involved in cell wall biosynthesis